MGPKLRFSVVCVMLYDCDVMQAMAALVNAVTSLNIPCFLGFVIAICAFVAVIFVP